jgi:uncharacterized protein (DUF3820 family)
MNPGLLFREAKAKPFRMPFGRYKGKTLAQINRSIRGHQYLLWAADRLEFPTIVKAIKEFLSSNS